MTLNTECVNQFLKQSPSYLQGAVHLRAAFLHSHLLTHPFLQLQAISS